MPWRGDHSASAKVKHLFHPAAVHRAKDELAQIALHVLAADLDMG